MVMMERPDPIPDDLPACQEMLRGLLERIRELERLLLNLEHQLEQTCSTTDELQRSYACLKEEYLALKRLLFGPKRERLPEAPGQLHLFDDGAPAVAPDESAAPASLEAPRANAVRGTAAED